jgi:hypothetical protein
MYDGALYGEQYLAGPDVGRSNGRVDFPHGFRPEDNERLVCVYGGSGRSRSRRHVIGAADYVLCPENSKAEHVDESFDVMPSS